MPSLVDIFNPSFFVFLGILVLVAALLVVYFESKMREQNHKMTSMLSLITCIADEMNEIKIHLNNKSNIDPINPSSLETNDVHIIKTKLIDVSDDSDDSDDFDSESSSDDSESNSEDIEEIKNIEDIEDIKETIEIGGEHNDIKVFKLNISNIDENNLDDNIDDLYAEDNDDDDDSISISSEDDEIEQKNNNEIDISNLNLKSINISNLEENKNSDIIDYKKFTLSRLRNVVIEKELVSESSKLKKNELLKLLGVE
jgi:hypothetical protein